MNENIERLDEYLKNIAPPSPASGPHRYALRRQVLGEIERKQTMFERFTSWRHAVVIALIGTGIVTAAVVGVTVHRYHFVKVDEEGRHVVVRQDDDNSGKAWCFSTKTATNPQQAVETAEEMDRLIAQNEKELVSICEIEVDGQLDSRKLGYMYYPLRRPDDPSVRGTIRTRGAGTLSKEQIDEARQCWMETLKGMTMKISSDGGDVLLTADGQEIDVYERVVQGRTFVLREDPAYAQRWHPDRVVHGPTQGRINTGRTTVFPAGSLWPGFFFAPEMNELTGEPNGF